MSLNELKRIEKTPLHVEVEAELLKKARAKARRRGLKMREVVEAALREFVAEADK